MTVDILGKFIPPQMLAALVLHLAARVGNRNRPGMKRKSERSGSETKGIVAYYSGARMWCHVHGRVACWSSLPATTDTRGSDHSPGGTGQPSERATSTRVDREKRVPL